MKSRIVNLNINGETLEAKVSDSDTLLETLRYELGLTGTKQGCDKGDCGACTVLINNKAVLSCLTLASVCENKNNNIKTKIETVENLENSNLLEAFDKTGALQCGFCQPGMLMSAKSFLEKTKNNPKSVNLDQIKTALSGNLCRCTGYTKIYEAVLLAAKEMRD